MRSDWFRPMSKAEYDDYLSVGDVPDGVTFEQAYAEYVENWKEARMEEKL